MNNLSLKFERYDFKELYKKIDDKEFWQKQHNIFEYDDVVVSLTLRSIDVAHAKISIDVRVVDNYFDINDYNVLELPIDPEHLNEHLFEKQLFHKIYFGIRWNERRLLKKMPVFEHGEQQNIESRKKIQERAKRTYKTLIREKFRNFRFVQRFEWTFVERFIDNFWEKPFNEERYIEDREMMLYGNVVNVLASQMNIKDGDDKGYFEIIRKNYVPDLRRNVAPDWRVRHE